MAVKQKILIVDDDNNIAELISLYLTKECFETEIVNDGESALTSFETFRPNLILLDLMLPGIDGYQVCREIRSKSATPIIMLSAKGEVFDKVLGLELGADDYMEKPFDTKELLARIRAMTRTGHVVNSTLTAGNITLNRATFELSSPSGSFRLANKEFQMMEMLMTNPKNLISTERFMEKIWGYDSETGWETVTVHVGRLRKRVESWPDFEIQSVRGLGYKAVKKT